MPEMMAIAVSPQGAPGSGRGLKTSRAGFHHCGVGANKLLGQREQKFALTNGVACPKLTKSESRVNFCKAPTAHIEEL